MPSTTCPPRSNDVISRIRRKSPDLAADLPNACHKRFPSESMTFLRTLPTPRLGWCTHSRNKSTPQPSCHSLVSDDDKDADSFELGPHDDMPLYTPPVFPGSLHSPEDPTDREPAQNHGLRRSHDQDAGNAILDALKGRASPILNYFGFQGKETDLAAPKESKLRLINSASQTEFNNPARQQEDSDQRDSYPSMPRPSSVQSGADSDNSASSSSKSTSSSTTRYKKTLELTRLFKDNIGSWVADYICAYSKDILRQGRLYVTTTHFAFNSTFFAAANRLAIPLIDIVSISKKNIALVIPNSILILTTNGNRYFLASFLNRDAAYLLLLDCWEAALHKHSGFAIHSVPNGYGTDSEHKRFATSGSEGKSLSSNSFLSSKREKLVKRPEAAIAELSTSPAQTKLKRVDSRYASHENIHSLDPSATILDEPCPDSTDGLRGSTVRERETVPRSAKVNYTNKLVHHSSSPTLSTPKHCLTSFKDTHRPHGLDALVQMKAHNTHDNSSLSPIGLFKSKASVQSYLEPWNLAAVITVLSFLSVLVVIFSTFSMWNLNRVVSKIDRLENDIFQLLPPLS